MTEKPVIANCPDCYTEIHTALMEFIRNDGGERIGWRVFGWCPLCNEDTKIEVWLHSWIPYAKCDDNIPEDLPF